MSFKARRISSEGSADSRAGNLKGGLMSGSNAAMAAPTRSWLIWQRHPRTKPE